MPSSQWFVLALGKLRSAFGFLCLALEIFWHVLFAGTRNAGREEPEEDQQEKNPIFTSHKTTSDPQ
jgi:hypothetical protein